MVKLEFRPSDKTPGDLAKKVTANVYQMQALQQAPRHTHVGISVFGTSQLYIGIQGTAFLGAIKLDEVGSGKSLQEQLNDIREKSGPELVSSLKAGNNMWVKVAPRDVVLLPAGYLMISHSTEGSVIFRKSFSPSNEDREYAKTRLAVDLTLETFPELRAEENIWAKWREYLGSLAAD